MTAFEELKESTKDSLINKQRVLSALIEEEKEESFQFRDAVLDIIGEALALYKVTVAEARASQSVEEVAALWDQTHAFYAGMLSLWQGLNVIMGGVKDPLFVYWGQIIEKLERTTAEHHAFHAE
jgi:hypothetical protein